jgi:hypothetical protein
MTYTQDGYQPKFDHDFTRGKVGENLVDTFLHALEGGSIEVKTDYRVAETGNFYIEFEQWGRSGQRKPSGIMTTEATYWVLASPDGKNGVFVETEWLRDLLERVGFTTAEQPIADGNTNASSGYLVPAQFLYRRMKLLP